MLPAECLITRTRRGKIMPVLSTLNDENLKIASNLIEIFRKSVGRKKEHLNSILEEIESDVNYRFIRGLCELLERRCVFEVKSVIDPASARKAVFEEGFVTKKEEREIVLKKVASRFGVSVDDLEKSMWADHEDELILSRFRSISPDELLKMYNLSLCQTLLFRATGMEISISGNYKNILRNVKQLGLMYTAEKRDRICVNIEGALSLFKLTEKYGNAIAKLLPTIIIEDKWEIKADILRKHDGTKRIVKFVLDSSYKNLLDCRSIETAEEPAFDSYIEERFAKKFNMLETGWKLRREPEPLISGNSIFLPDFSFEKDGLKLYMEIIGFWTEDYIKRKMEKLSQLKESNIIIAVDEKLACSDSKLRSLRGKVIFYRKEVPIKPVLRFLREHEEEKIRREISMLRHSEIELVGDIIRVDELARRYDVGEEVIRRTVRNDRYMLVGDVLISRDTAERIKRKIEGMPDKKLVDAVKLLKKEGITNAHQMLDMLGYRIKWNGLDPEKAVIVRKN